MVYSSTLLKQERYFIEKLLDQANRSENLDKVNFTLGQLEGKYLHNLPISELHKQVYEILIKLKKDSLINEFHIASNENISLGLPLEVNLINRIGRLRRRWSDLNNMITSLNSEAKATVGKKNTILSNNHPIFASKIPKDKRTREVIIPMAYLFERKGIGGHVDNEDLFKCIDPVVGNQLQKTIKEKNVLIGYRLRTLNKHIEKFGLRVKRRSNFSYLDNLKE